MPSNTQIQGIVEDMPRHLQTEILERYMNEQEIRTFWKKYEEHKKRERTISRFSFMQKEVTKEDLQLVKDYMNEDIESSELLSKYGKNYASRVLTICKRIIAQGLSV